MTRSEKGELTQQDYLLKMLRQFPGTIAKNVPQAKRRFLRKLEQENKIEYKNGGWYIKES